MQWYYVKGADRKGPVPEEEFQSLVQQGVVTPDTLVWREGMANWVPFSATAPPHPGTAPAADVKCAGCGGTFNRSEVIPLGTGLYCAACKPLAIQRLKEGVLSNADAEETRKQYLKHEASVKSVGILYYLGGVGLLLIGLFGFAAAGSRSREIEILPGLFLIALAVGQFWTGTGLRRLKPWARIPTGIFSGIGLIGFPVGTLINGYILYLIFSRKGKMVFSEEYRAVIQQTPHIKYRTSIVLWIVLGLLLALILFGLTAAFFARSN